MDKLATYSSDSEDNCSEEVSKGSDSSRKTSVSVSRKQKCFENENTHYNSSEVKLGQENNTKINFFGFDGDHSGKNPKETESSGEEENRVIHIRGSSVEVPKGDFWRYFSEAEVPKESENAADSAESRKRKFESPWIPKKHEKVQSLDTSKTRRHKESHKKCGRTNYPDSPVSSSDSYQSHGAGAEKHTPLQSDLTVKVYTVHPKISPHLNRHHGNHCASKESHRWAAHTGVINRISWCSVASFSHLLLSASMDSTVRVWNAWGQQTQCVRTLTPHSTAVRDAQWSVDGRRVLSCSYDRTAAITDVHTGQCQAQFEHSSYVSAGKFHPVTPHLVVTGTTDSIQVWDTRQPDIPARIFTHKEQLGQTQDLMFSHDGQELFSCGDVVTRESADRSVMAWDFRTGVILSNQIFQERYTVTRLCLHPTLSQFVAQTHAGYAAVFSTQRPYKMNKNKRFEGHKCAGYSVGLSLSQDGSLLYSGSSDGRLFCYNFNNGKRIRTLNSGGILLDVAAHPVLPSVVAGATWDGDIVVFQ
ncbi:WD repeat-containing protein 25-like [Littorina saxatilis]|uniref:WD repeat-containing protein 25 n=1 Tax=Littorina saxatilis TaxID=31220 RepID=A0AAN9BHL0_9CAEN